MDGWGITNTEIGNAVAKAKTPNVDKYQAAFPHGQLMASGESVGLPKGESGSSTTGHLNLGAGRVVYQDLVRINMSIADGRFFENPVFKQAISFVKKNDSRLHLMGMVGSAGVHSSLQHLFALLKLAKENKVSKTYLHLFTDGRDSPPKSAPIFLEQVKKQMSHHNIGEIATIMGRFYAMDRDHRWERTKKAYEAIACGEGLKVSSANEAIKLAYQRDETDEFIKPTVITKNGKPVATVDKKDAVIFFNFRIDRPRQLTKAFVLDDFEEYQPKKTSFDPYAEKYGEKLYAELDRQKTFKRKKVLKNIFFATMTEYEEGLPAQAAFPRRQLILPLAQAISQRENRQFHIAETEKERFVTYYFNGFHNRPFPYEEWYEVSSPPVKTYDQQPEMSASQITDKVIDVLRENNMDFILVNFANPDMVGHTGVLEAGIKACESVDRCVGKIAHHILLAGGTLLLTADHGNAEEMINLPTGEVDTSHSGNPVPFIVVGQQYRGQIQQLQRGVLADVAPTVLKLLGINQPAVMTGQPLI